MIGTTTRGAVVVTPCEHARGFHGFFREADLYEKLHLHVAPLHRFFSLMRKLRARTLVTEDDIKHTEFDQEDEDIGIRCDASTPGSQTKRISCFSTQFDNAEQVADQPPGSCLGYLILRDVTLPNGNHNITAWESVVVPPSARLTNWYLHSHACFRTTVCGRDFEVRGSYFCQQNGLTSVCAHSALRTSLNNLRDRLGLSDQDLVTYRGLNQILDIDHRKRKVGNRYLCTDWLTPFTTEDICKVADHFGLEPFGQDYFADPYALYWEFLHTSTDGGYPTLFGFTSGEQPRVAHVIAVVGHTWNSELWLPDAELGSLAQAPVGSYQAAAAWVDHFIVQDDNLGTYCMLPARSLWRVTLPKADPESRACVAITLLDRDVHRAPSNATDKAGVVVTRLVRQEGRTGNQWHDELFAEVTWPRRAPVFRTLLKQKEPYLSYLRETPSVDRTPGAKAVPPEVVDVLEALMPDLFWVVEVTLRDIYTANRSKLGDVYFDVQQPASREQPHVGFLAAWWPGFMYVQRNGPDGRPYLIPIQTSQDCYVPLYLEGNPFQTAEF